MRKNISVGALIMAIICAFVSCGTGDDTYSTSTSDNAAITAFTLGTVKDTLTVLDDDGNVIKKKGTTVDSVTVTTYTGSTFAVCIDQLDAGVYDGEEYSGRIYNTDSLPYNSYMKMLATVSSLNSGTVVYQEWSKDPATDSWTSYYSTDSINFSNTLRFRVYSTDRTNSKDYKVDIKRHNERSNIYRWYDPTYEAIFLGSDVLKGLSTSEGLYVLCDNGLYKSTDSAKSWQRIGDAVGQSLVAQGTNVYVLDHSTSKLYLNGSIVDGAQVSDLKCLAAAGTKILCAVSEGNKFMESIDGGINWSEGSLGANEKESYIPVKDICYTVIPNSTNDLIEHITVIGNMDSNLNPKDTCAVIWNKTVNKADGSTVDKWVRTSVSQTSHFLLPRLADLSSCAYNKTWLLAIGGNPEVSGILSTPYDRIYVSRQGDNGITWERATGLKLPGADEESDKSGSLLMSDYKGQYFYFIVPASGNVWRGNLNDAVWEKADK